MPVVVTCQCSTTFELKDEFAGRLVKCPKCGSENRAPGEKLNPKSQADPVFDRDIFLLRQKVMAIKQKYAVSDEKGHQILYVERPAHAFRNLLAMLAGITASIPMFVLTFWAADALSRSGNEGGSIAAMFAGLALSGIALVVVGIGLSRKRHVSFYRGEQKGDKVLEVLQYRKFEFLTSTFVVCDAAGQHLAILRKNMLSNIFRKKWRLDSMSGQPILVAHEDSIILSLLRRLLGPFFGLLRTNFILVDPSGNLLGEFQRKLTILDRYALDLRPDANRKLDRRLALAVGVVLDTGERR